MFEINITAYKHPQCVNSLVSQIRIFLPKSFIRIWDNSPEYTSYPDVDEIRWNRFNPSLSRVWNWAILQSKGEWVMVSNDDINLHKDWHSNLIKEIEQNPESLWHGPSRCFLFNKKLLDSVGLFDERFTDFCFEDLDYIRRMNSAGVKHNYGGLSCLNNDAESLKNTIERQCHTANNKSFFNEKYTDTTQQNFFGTPRIPTPNFYPLCQK